MWASRDVTSWVALPDGKIGVAWFSLTEDNFRITLTATPKEV
jgi:hypothetical protein